MILTLRTAELWTWDQAQPLSQSRQGLVLAVWLAMRPPRSSWAGASLAQRDMWPSPEGAGVGLPVQGHGTVLTAAHPRPVGPWQPFRRRAT